MRWSLKTPDEAKTIPKTILGDKAMSGMSRRDALGVLIGASISMIAAPAFAKKGEPNMPEADDKKQIEELVRTLFRAENNAGEQQQPDYDPADYIVKAPDNPDARVAEAEKILALEPDY
ncbi:MAG: hypothetical protein M3347_10505, partial [Armatimonadota bacterium]|nr:hypothetical protein [Armatimonadota bacterium]